MDFWKILSYFLFGHFLIELTLRASAAPVGGSGSCELRLQFFKQDAERQLAYFDVVTREGTPMNTTFRYCKLAQAVTSVAEAERYEFPFRLERLSSPFDHLLKVVFVVDGVSFLRNRGRFGNVVTVDLLCDDLDVKCIKFPESELDQSQTFVQRKLLSMTAESYVDVGDPFLAVFIASAGVILVILILGLCASCNGKEDSSSPVQQNAQLLSVCAITPVEKKEPHVQVEAQETKTGTESIEKPDFAQHINPMREATAAVAEPTSHTPLQQLSGEITHDNTVAPTTSEEVFDKEGQLGMKGQKVKDPKGRASSSVSSDRSSRGSTKFDDEHKVEKGEHKDDKHHKDEKHHIGEKFHGLKKKLSIRAGKRSLSRESINEIDEKTKEKEREGSKKDKKFISDKGINTKDPVFETEHRSKCPTPPHDRFSRELPKLPFESDPSILGPSSFGRPLPPERVLSEPAATLDNECYEAVDERLRSREVRAASVGENDTLYEIVETKSKETMQPPVRPSSGVSQQYEAVDFVELKRVAMQNRVAKNTYDEYTEVPDTVKSHTYKSEFDDKTSVSSTDNDFYTLVKEDSGVIPDPVLDLYAEVSREGPDKKKQTDPVAVLGADLLYAEPYKPSKGVDTPEISEEKIKEQSIPAPPSVDSLRSISVSGRSLSESDSIPSESLIVRSQSDPKTHVFHRETDPKKLEEMYSKVNFALKKKHSAAAVESGSSVIVKVFHREEDDDQNQLDDESDDDSNPPPVPSSLYAPIPTVNERVDTDDGGNETLTIQGGREKTVSKTSLTYEEIGPNLTEEKQTEVNAANMASDSKNPNNNNLLEVEMAAAGGNRMSTGSEAYEEITPVKKKEPDNNNRTSSIVLEVKSVTVKKEGSYEDVSPQGDIHGGCSDELNRTSPGNSYKTAQSDKSELVNDNFEITKPRNEGKNTSVYYETLENVEVIPSSHSVGKHSSTSIPNEPDNSSLTDAKDGASLYEEVVVRKDEKKIKKSRFSSSKMKTLAQI